MFYERTKVYATILISAMLLISCSGDFDGDEGVDREPNVAQEIHSTEGKDEIAVQEIETRSNAGCTVLTHSSEKNADEIMNANMAMESIYGDGFQNMEKLESSEDLDVNTKLIISISEELKQKIINDNSDDQNADTRGGFWKKKWFHASYWDEGPRCLQYKAYTLFDAFIIALYRLGLRGVTVGKGKC